MRVRGLKIKLIPSVNDDDDDDNFTSIDIVYMGLV